MNKSNYPHPIIAKEGWLFLAIAFALAVFFSSRAPFLVSLFLWLIFFFVLQFFRDPARVIPEQANAILSPADGRVVKVEQAEDPYRKIPALKISVFMNVFNVHSNRSPIDATVTQVVYNRGAFVNAALDKASLENERNALYLTRADGREITCVQIAGLIARRILCYVNANDTVTRGQRYGFIRFGSRVDVYLPVDARPRVAVGDVVSATETILAELD
jgi:phosphatidylserine decarboxylase